MMRPLKLSGLIGYVVFALWFLLAVLNPVNAQTADGFAQIKVSDLAPQIEDALIAKGAPANASAIFSKPDQEVSVSPGEEPTLTSVSYSRHSGRFLIRLQGAENTQSVAIAGNVVVIQSLPVLTRAIDRGEVISEDDIAWVETQDFVAPIILRNADDIIGKAAKRALGAQKPLRKTDFEAALLIKKGASVTMIVERPGLRLTNTGIAKDSGAMGDIIAVESVSSDQVLKAVVTGRNVAVVGRRPASSRHASAVEFRP